MITRRFLPARCKNAESMVSLVSPLLVAAVLHAPTGLSETQVIGVLHNTLPEADAALGPFLVHALDAAGLSAVAVTPDALAEGARLPSTLILTDSGRLPTAAAAPLEAFLAGGGTLIALGAPLFDEPFARDGDIWLSRSAYRRQVRALLPEHVLESFDGPVLPRWERLTNAPDNAVTHALDAQTGDRGPCLHVRVAQLSGWESLRTDNLRGGIPAGHTLTCLRVKGGPTTRNLSVEWQEQDGSRWIATVPLTTAWRHVVLHPEDFHFWESVPARKNSALNLSAAERLSIGLAFSHGATPGSHEYWVDEIGTAHDPWRSRGLAWEPAFTPRDGLFPGYKVYPCADVQRMHTAPEQALLPYAEFPLPESVWASHPRPAGTGFRKSRAWRWVALLEAQAPAGDSRGAPAVLILDRQTRAAWVSFTIRDEDFYRSPAFVQTLGALLRRLHEPLFLLEGGATPYTAFADQPFIFGATLLARSDIPDGYALRMRVTNEAGAFQGAADVPISATAAGVTELSIPLALKGHPPAGAIWNISTELLRGEHLVDRISHELATLVPPQDRSFVSVRDGCFLHDGKPWFIFGINYMPSSGIAVEDPTFFEHWLGAAPYGPEVIDRDLGRIAGLGFNAVSVYIDHRSLGSNNLPDLLRRCETHGLKVNLSLRPGTPLDFPWEMVREIIETSRLAENDTIFAYDLAWEPSHGGFQARMRYAPEWTQFVLRRYGSVAQAVRIWGSTPALDGDTLRVPSDDEVFTEGPWAAQVADYRDFLDALLEQHYGRARELVRSIDPHHLVSFRMSSAGDPTYSWRPGGVPYDFVGLARAVDFMAPEGYGRVGDWEQVRPGLFTVAMARAAAPQLPVFWAEAGMSVWDLREMRPTDELLQRQARFYEDFCHMLRASYSNGVAFWWYAGGFRLYENSDYGVINPDGTDRPVTRVLRAQARPLHELGSVPMPDVWFEVDRRPFATGIVGLYASVRDRYWSLVEQGYHVGLRVVETTSP